MGQSGLEHEEGRENGGASGGLDPEDLVLLGQLLSGGRLGLCLAHPDLGSQAPHLCRALPSRGFD